MKRNSPPDEVSENANFPQLEKVDMCKNQSCNVAYRYINVAVDSRKPENTERKTYVKNRIYILEGRK